MIDDIFIKYANSSLKDNPGILLDLLREFIESGYVDGYDGFDDSARVDGFRYEEYIKKWHEKIFTYFEKFAKFDSYPDAVKAYDEEKNEIINKNLMTANDQEDLNDSILRLNIGFRGSWTCESVGCENCSNYAHRFKLMAKNNSVIYGPDRIRCYECNQLFFRHTLAAISQGLDYPVDGLISNGIYRGGYDYGVPSSFSLIINSATKFIKRDYVMASEGGFSIKERKFYAPDIWQIEPKEGEINRYWRDVFFWLTTHDFIGLSLLNFLIENDKRKLKFCEECNSFYIAKTLRNQRFCSSQCRLAYHNRKSIQSGEAKKYKRKKRSEGAKESYYG